MSDPWVLSTQTWLNNTYENVTGWVTVPETGRTGWRTMYGLTRALQHEMGFTSLSDNFGNGTFNAVDDIAPINNSTSNKNIIRIIQGGLYCKGYNGGNGDLDGVYSAQTISAVQSLRTDIGLSAGTGGMTPKVFKALLNMDAYVLIDGGSPQIRAIQRNLNGRYVTRQDFFVIPADGFFSRSVQNALMLALQYELGMGDGVANGTFGPGTRNGLQTRASLSQGASDASSDKYFVHLYQAALTFNGYSTPYDGVFGASTSATTRAFQSFAALPVTGEGNFQTWASLLVSTGDTSRPGTAADCVSTITTARAATLVANGYQTVGRYLTNSPVIDPLDKNIKPGELAAIFDNGLTVFPIFQEGADYLEYFTFSRGLYAGGKAHEVAGSYGFKAGTTIYFAVDFDALQDEVRSNVVPYFQGIKEAMAGRGNRYKVGVYGPRNTCSIVSAAGLATRSFVSGMSTGYSGNLGYPLPTNWAFDQILEYTIGTGAGQLGIDKGIKRPSSSAFADPGQSAVDAPSIPPSIDPNSALFDYIDALYAQAVLFNKKQAMGPSANERVLQYLRYDTYGGTGDPLEDELWRLVAGDVYDIWVTSASSVPGRVTTIIDPKTGLEMKLAHTAVAANSVIHNGLPASTSVNVGDMGGWAGDLLSLYNDYVDDGRPIAASVYASLHIGDDGATTTFSWEDLRDDVDGFNIARAVMLDPSASIADAFRSYFSLASSGGGTWRTRFSTFTSGRFANMNADVVTAANWLFAEDLWFDVATIRAAIFRGKLMNPAQREVEGADFSEEFRRSLEQHISGQ